MNSLIDSVKPNYLTEKSYDDDDDDAYYAGRANPSGSYRRPASLI